MKAVRAIVLNIGSMSLKHKWSLLLDYQVSSHNALVRMLVTMLSYAYLTDHTKTICDLGTIIIVSNEQQNTIRPGKILFLLQKFKESCARRVRGWGEKKVFRSLFNIINSLSALVYFANITHLQNKIPVHAIPKKTKVQCLTMIN